MARPRVRIAGIAREVAGGPVTYRITCNGTTTTRSKSGKLVIDAEGRQVTLKVKRVDLRGSGRVENGAIGELVQRSGQKFDGLERIPPTTQASMEIVCAAAGDAVEAFGEVTASDPQGRATALSPQSVAVGANAPAAMDRAVARSPEGQLAAAAKSDSSDPSPLWWLVPLAALGAAVAWPLLKREPMRPALALSFALVAAAFVLRPMPTGVVFYSREKRVAGGDAILVIQLLVLGGAIGIFFVPHRIGAWWTADLLLAAIGLLALIAILVARSSNKYAHAITGTPAWTGEHGKRARVRGRVRAMRFVTVGNQQVAFGFAGHIETHWSRTSGSRFLDRASSDNNQTVMGNSTFCGTETFAIETDRGDVLVDPEELVWSSTVSSTYDEQETDNSESWRYVTVVPNGAEVVAVGWLSADTKGARLRAKGNTPALLIAAGPGEDPTVRPRRLGRAVWVTVLGVALAAGATGALQFKTARDAKAATHAR